MADAVIEANQGAAEDDYAAAEMTESAPEAEPTDIEEVAAQA
jgi:hypothetical protein